MPKHIVCMKNQQGENDMIGNAYDLGCSAAEAGLPEGANPYKGKSATLFTAWKMGWDTVMYDIRNPRA